MDNNNDFVYLLMSSLKHPYREHMTKESTGLLMKELDQAAACVARPSSHTTASTGAGSSSNNDFRFGHHHQPQHGKGLTFGSPKSPDNVARTILTTIGAGPATSSTTSQTHGYDSKRTAYGRRSTSSGSIAAGGPLTNGHHHQQSHQQQQYPKAPSPLLARCRRKLHLQLNRKNFEAKKNEQDREHAVEEAEFADVEEHNLPKEYIDEAEDEEDDPTIRHCRALRVCTSLSASDDTPPSTSSNQQRQTVLRNQQRHFARNERLNKQSAPVIDREEHRLIAYNSSLLMVKPTASGNTAAATDSGTGGASSSGASSIAGDPMLPQSLLVAQQQPRASISTVVETEAVVVVDHDQMTRLQKQRQELRERAISRHTTNGSVATSLSPIGSHAPKENCMENSGLFRSVHEERDSNDAMLFRRQHAPDMAGSSSTEPEPSPEPLPGVTTSVSTPATADSLNRLHNRLCTSYRIKVPAMKNPVDACLLPNDDIAIADYDNGLLILNALGDIVEHRKTPNELNACGVTCSRGPLFRLYLLVVRDGVWTVNIYQHHDLVETARCPTDTHIENWALRRLVAGVDARLHLLASGESKSSIWTYETDRGEWRQVVSESSGRKTSGNYNDMSVKFQADTKETRILLCDWKKAQLWALSLNEKGDVSEQKSIKMRRIKGQEWIVQGPCLAVLDEQSDILVYDGSGKLFLFDGENYKCKKVVADVGRGEVSALTVGAGWVYALCRYRLCVEAYMYKEYTETNI